MRLLLLLCIIISGAAHSQTTIGRQKVDQFPITTSGSLTYGLTWLPTDYNTSTTKYPLIIFLHGAGEDGDGISGLNQLISTALPKRIADGWNPEAVNPADGQTYKFIVVSPQAPENSNFSYSYTHVRNILADVLTRYRVDQDRIYITGLSAGGGGTWSSVTNDDNFTKKIAAIVPISSVGIGGGLGNMNKLRHLIPTHGVKVWTICGAEDSYYGLARTFVDSVNMLNPTPEAIRTGIPGAGHSGSAWNTAYNPAWRTNEYNLNLFEWLLQYKRNTTSTTPTANAGADQNIPLPLTVVTLSGTGTAFGGNTIASQTWTRVSGPGSITISTPLLPVTTIIGLGSGTHVFRYTVRDNLNQTASDDVTINVAAVNQAPVANAGADRNITLPANSLTITGSGTDTDGTISSYQWTRISGPTSFNIVSATQAQTVINGLVEGQYGFELTVTDNQGASDKDTVIVTVNPAPPPPPNQAPVASAGTDQSITLPVNTVTLNGNATDSDGTIASYQWTKISGPASYTIASSTQAQTSINGLIQGQYGFELTVTDNQGASDKDTVLVTVNAAPPPPPNQAPVANAGADQTITLPVNTVTLNGSGTDSDGTVASYQWTRLTGPGTVSIADANQAQTAVNNLEEGNYSFELLVTDNNGATGKDTVVVVVNAATPPPPPVNNVPVANAGADQTITLPANSVTLNGNGTDTDGTIVSYLWTRISGPATALIADANQAQTAVNNLEEGVYSFELTVTDNQGAIAKDIVVVTVNSATPPPPVNEAPVANAGADQNITLPVNTVTLNGSGTDSDGTVASYLWTRITGSATAIIADANQAQTAVNNLEEGIYSFELTITDNDGAIGKDTVIVIVNAAIPPPPPVNVVPVANAGTDQTITLPVNTITLNGSGTDTDGTITSYLWTRITGSATVIIADASQAQTAINNLEEGTYSFELTVTDNEGASAKDTLVVIVNAAIPPPPVNEVPVANAGSDQTITLPLNQVTLYGSGTDNDGTIASYQWTKIAGPTGLSILSPNQAETDVTNLVEGLYRFQLVVTDDQGAIDRDTVIITVKPVPPPPPVNIAPVANAGPDQSITWPANTVVLNGSGTDDGNIVSYQWTKISGPATYIISTPNQAQTSVLNLVLGTYGFELLVGDNLGAVDADTVWITVNDAPSNPNQPHDAPLVNPSALTYSVTAPSNSFTITTSPSASSPAVISNVEVTKWKTPGFTPKVLVGIGSSSMQGAGASNSQMAMFGLLRTYYFGTGHLRQSWNLGLGGINIGHGLPDGTVPPPGASAPDTTRNISAAIRRGADIVVVCYPTNAYDVMSVADILWSYQKIYDYAVANGVQCWLQSPITRANFSAANKQKLVTIKDSMMARFPVGPNGGAIDILTPLLQPGTNEPIDAYQAGDGIHINNAGHRVVYEVMKSVNIFRNLIPSASTIANPGNAVTQVNNLEQGVHYFQVGVRDSYGNAADTIVMVTQHPQTGCAGQRRILSPFNGGISLVGGAFEYNPGDTIILSSSFNNWSYISLTNIHGTPSCPIIVMNSGGQIRMRDGISIQNCSYIRVLGTGSNDFYGFHIESPDQSGTAVSISGKSRVIEISNVSIRNKAYGSWCKNEASCDPTINNWTLDSISVHDWKIRNTASQGLYWGSTSPSGLRPVVCNGVTIYPKPSRLDNLKIYNMDIDSTGRAGIQVSAGQDRNNPGVSEIHNNVIRNTGRQLDDSQGGAISLGGYTRAYVHNNDIKYSYIWGIWGVGASLSRIENNRVDSIGWHKGVSTQLKEYATPIMVQSTELDPQDSVQYIVRNNHVGIGGSTSPGRVWIAGAYLRRTPGLNFVCGNKNLNETPAQVSIAAGAVYSGNCSGGNVTPVASAGADQTITLPVNNVTVNGSGTDADGTIVSYLWRQISGPATYTIASPAQAQTAINNLVQGVYKFELKVTDNLGASDRDTLTITVNGTTPPPNQLPVANAGTDRLITLPTNTVNLNGSGSDPDGTVAGYLWTKISGPATFSIATPTQAQTLVNNLVQGTYQFELRVTDNQGGVDRDTVVVTVNPAAPPPNQAPVANAGTDIIISLPANTVNLNGNGTDADGTIAGYIWTKISGPATFSIATPSQAQTLVNNLVQGVYQFELRVTDNQGAVGRDTVVVTVNAAAPPPNQAPVAYAGADITISLPSNTVNLNGTGTDPDGSIGAYQWTKISGPAGFVIASPAQAQTAVNNLLQGVYSFELRVTDNQGATGRDTVNVTVNAAGTPPPPPNQAPVANAGADHNITLPVNTVTVNGSGTDADGTIASYLWTKISGPVNFNIANPTQAQTIINNMVQGVYGFELRVTDNQGAIDRDTMMVTVNAAIPLPNQAPLAFAGADHNITLPANTVTLNGSGTDADGTIASYLWTRISGPSSFTIVSSTQAQTVVNSLVQGVYRFELRVSDNLGAFGRDTVTVTVNAAVTPPPPPPPPVNQPPVANAGADIVITLPVNDVTLLGSGADADGSVVAYQWRRITGPVIYSISTPNQAQTEVTSLVEGVYKFELTVLDDDGATGKDTILVTVNPLPPSKATLYPNPATDHINIRIEANTHVNNSELRIFDVSGRLVYYESFIRNTNIMTKTVNVSALPSGSYYVEVEVDINNKVVCKFVK